MTQCIHDLFEDKDTYERLALKAFEEYQNRLNWLHTAREFSGLFQKLVTSGSAH